VEYEWDPSKSSANFAKHGILLADAVAALEDDLALTRCDPLTADEERWITMGTDGFGRLPVVVYTWRGRRIRLISARAASPRERREYEEADET